MAQSLEQYVSQYTQAYQPAYDAIQAQLDAQPGRLEATNQQINRDYAQQQATLNRNRNAAAETASMQAAGSGGSFGGAANIANRKYYEQSFVPAQAQLQTNQANALANARQANEDQRLSLTSQLANLKSQATAAATQQYYSDLEAERARQAQAAQQNAYYKYLMEAAKNAQNSGGVKTWDFGNGYKVYDNNGEAMYTLNGNQISRGDFLSNANVNNWNLWNDIWNSGTKTNGIGSDTISLYNNLGNNSYLKNMLRNDYRTSYLY